MSTITPEQFAYYHENRSILINEYLADFPKRVDPDAVRDLFIPSGYDRSNVSEYQEICKLLTEDIYFEALIRNKLSKKLIFAAGLPGSGKSTHLAQMMKDELVYDGTLNDDDKFIDYIEKALTLGYKVEVFVYSVEPSVAFERNLERGDDMKRYVPISHYEKVAATLNRRQKLLADKFQSRVSFRNFEHTNFEGKQVEFVPIKIDRDELERIANNHEFRNHKNLHSVLR
ncbi:Zeta toxin [Algoriphagus locisalis]|uniref:Zeta toxin n=1 Tax=Algoriphagus locisalis TaxID=305507 RepID=A0A1I7CFI5_9BACT|nr:zeta toxin family protein [Algoriphagus locisalis]SFT98151.1 Zeta toxin [Algoriphagus locisalis]